MLGVGINVSFYQEMLCEIREAMFWWCRAEMCHRHRHHQRAAVPDPDGEEVRECQRFVFLYKVLIML